MKGINWTKRKMHYPLSDKLVLNIVKTLNLKPTDTLLDIGSGNGILTCRLKPYVKEIIGTDTESFNHSLFKFYKTESNKLPFKDKEFDKVLCHCTAYYFPNRQYLEDSIKEMKRVCKEKILIVGMIPYQVPLWLKLKRAITWKLYPSKRLIVDKSFFRKIEGVKILKSNPKIYNLNFKYRYDVLIENE